MASPARAGSWENGIAERWVGSCRREILDHVIALSETHLRRLIRDYIAYHHDDRIHDSLNKDTPHRRPARVRGRDDQRAGEEAWAASPDGAAGNRQRDSPGEGGRVVFVPQSYQLGQEAQVDWFEATAKLGGERCVLQFFAMRSMASGDAFHRAYRLHSETKSARYCPLAHDTPTCVLDAEYPMTKNVTLSVGDGRRT